MASTSTIAVASTTSTKNLNATGKTDAQVGDILEWFILGWASPMPEGLTQAQQRQWKLDQAHTKIWDYVRSEARRNRLSALRAEQANIEEQATQETEL